jgi:hypothetical protein
MSTPFARRLLGELCALRCGAGQAQHFALLGDGGRFQDEHHNRSRNVADGTTNMSIVAMPSASLARKLRLVGDVGGSRRTGYLDTVA